MTLYNGSVSMTLYGSVSMTIYGSVSMTLHGSVSMKLPFLGLVRILLIRTSGVNRFLAQNINGCYII